jgi:hypothetical protein
MIDKLVVHTVTQQAVVVLDAGIATEENLALIKQKGYQYLCVSRAKPKDYQYIQNRLTVLMQTRNQADITIKSISVQGSKDCYIEINSPSKQHKEAAMDNQFCQRFEEMLEQ